MNPKNISRLKPGDKCIVIDTSNTRLLLNQVVVFVQEDFGSDSLILRCPYKKLIQYMHPHQFKIWEENETI